MTNDAALAWARDWVKDRYRDEPSVAQRVDAGAWDNEPIVVRLVEAYRAGHSAAQAEAAARVAGLEAEVARLREALGIVCENSNLDWNMVHKSPEEALETVHDVAVSAYYFKPGARRPERRQP